MKINNIILPAVAAAVLLTGCDDMKMEWGKPEGHNPVTSADIPIAVKEVIANYGTIKEYSAQYTPNMLTGLGFGWDAYIAADTSNPYRTLPDENFQMFTPGNAMKMGVMVNSSGKINFETLDNMLAVMPQDMKLYGHNFLWHTQQPQTYLLSLIAPEKEITTDGGDVANELSGDASDFNGGTSGGWGSWGNNKKEGGVQSGAGPDGSPAMVLTNNGDGEFYHAQFGYTFNEPLKTGVKYIIKFKAKSTSAAGKLQFQYQNGTTYGSQGGYADLDVTTEWQEISHEFTITDHDDVNRIILNFGKVGGTYYIDDIQFGLKVADPMDNMLGGTDTDFEGEKSNWGSWGDNKKDGSIQDGAGQNGSRGMVLTNKGDGEFHQAQFAYTFDAPLKKGTPYIIQFYAKSTSAAGRLQVQYQNGTTYNSQGLYAEFEVGTDWTLCEKEFTITNYDDVNRIIINFGKVSGTYYIDNVKFGPKKETTRAAARKAMTRASTITYKLKSAEEKREALLTALDSWIKGMADHLQEKGVTPYGYDVINEPITEDGYVRGFDGHYGSNNNDGTPDSTPTESETDGLSLNWASDAGNQHFYWGYYVPDYAVQAFQMARRYLPAETKLFVNDYNLESNTTKLNALIDFVKKIDTDNGSAIVDGIGTQMHLYISTSDDTEANAENVAALKTKVDAMFKTMAATGKLVRVTELDVQLGSGVSSPSSAQYQAQADVYRMVVESYKANVPEAQQSGITIWTLSDNETEHEYWQTGDHPNLWDSDYKRKWAYKGFCDGLAGEDLGLKFGGEDYKAYYEKNNVSSTVTE